MDESSILNVSQHHDPSEPIFSDLKAEDEAAKTKAATELCELVTSLSTEMTSESFAAFCEVLACRISVLMEPSSTVNEKLSGILALDHLIDCDAIDVMQKTIKFSNQLRLALKSDNYAVLNAASQALGHLVRPGGAYIAELVEAEMTTALEWLRPENKGKRRLAAVLLVREIASNSPTLIYTYLPQILDAVWDAVQDVPGLVRQNAAQTLGVCLDVIASRNEPKQEGWFQDAWSHVLDGCQAKAQIHHTHGSLLVLEEMLHRGIVFMSDHYSTACERIFGLKDHRNSEIRSQTIQLVPVLASYAPLNFVNHYLHRFMVHLLAQLKRGLEREKIFLTLGSLAQDVGAAIVPYLDDIFLHIHHELEVEIKGRTNGHNHALVGTDPIFRCLGMFVRAIGQAASQNVEKLLDLIFACFLSEQMETALADISRHIPSLRLEVQENLLNVLSLSLLKVPYRSSGCPNHMMVVPPPFKERHPRLKATRGEEFPITLNLQTLGSFDFSGHVLHEFVCEVTLRYMTHADAKIRRAAALMCCQRLSQDPIMLQSGQHATQFVRGIVRALLTTAIGDPEAHIREAVLNNMGHKFDRYLAAQENIHSLSLAFYDRSFTVREVAIGLVGRLSAVNPAYVLPMVRKFLINLLLSLSLTNTARQKEEAARLLTLLAIHATDLATVYIDPMVDAFLILAKDTSPGLSATTMRALGQLTQLDGLRMHTYIPKIMPIISYALRDLGSRHRRVAAMDLLTALAVNTGYVIEPYLHHPNLLPIVLNAIRTEPHEEARSKAIRLVGVLGALDPYKAHQVTMGFDTNQAEGDGDQSQAQDGARDVSDTSLIVQGLTPSNEEYFPTVVFNALLQTILSDPTLSQHHMLATDAIVTIFKTMGTRCVPFLKQIIPAFTVVMQTSPASHLKQYFHKLCVLVDIVKQHARSHVDNLVKLIDQYWAVNRQVQLTILSLIEVLSRSLTAEFKPYLSKLIPMMLRALDQDTQPDRETSIHVLSTIVAFGSNATDFMPLLVPAIIGLSTEHSFPINVRRAAVETIVGLGNHIDLSDFASAIIHPMSMAIASSTETMKTSTENILKMRILDCICAVGFQLGENFHFYIPTVQRAVDIGAIAHDRFTRLATAFDNDLPLSTDFVDIYTSVRGIDGKGDIDTIAIQSVLSVSQQRLQIAWSASDKSTQEDWQEWMKRILIELLKQSPSPALRACSSLANMYPPLAKSLFNSAFASCWVELDERFQEDFIQSVETVLTSRTLPPDILQILLNLAEFMEHDDKALPIDIRSLARFATKCHAYAKALHYKELEFEQDQNSQNVEALISLNTHLQQTDAAIGILNRVAQHGSIKIREAWLEKLHRWDDALAAYEMHNEPRDFDIVIGKIRCFHALGEWRALLDIAQERWDDMSNEHQKGMSALAAAAAWGQGEWTLMDRYVSVMAQSSPDRAFFGAILAVQNNQYEEARKYILQARASLNLEVTTTIAESYNRAYGALVRVQILEELEEAITYKLSVANPVRQCQLRELWIKRLSGCESDVDVWQRMLKVRALALTPRDDPVTWLKFSSLCRKANKITLAERALKSLENDIQGSDSSYVSWTRYARLKLDYASGQRVRALASLKSLALELSAEHQISVERSQENRTVNEYLRDKVEVNTIGRQSDTSEPVKSSVLLSKCFSRLAGWQIELLRGDWTSVSVHDTVQEILQSYSAAIKHNETYDKTWHRFALANFELIDSIVERIGSGSEHAILDHVVPAIKGFFQAISLSSHSSLQDILRLLTLWFTYGAHDDVDTEMSKGFGLVSENVWLEVIPQLVAHINQPNIKVRATIHKLLLSIGEAHPQSLVYPLTVAMKSAAADRACAASQIMDRIRDLRPLLVAQVQLVSHELIRVAVLWHELWFEALEEASRLYFADGDVSGMLRVLQPLHKLLDRQPETLREISFVQAFGQDLTAAQSFCAAYQQSGDVKDLNRAWDLYYTVYRKVQRQLPQMKTLDLSYVSPRLRDIKDLELAVPGTYRLGRPLISISHFEQRCVVIDSKQRPRRIVILASNGQSYVFALKGHEDIRQDERVMQLFGLCNTILNKDRESFKRRLHIQCFPVIPLSQNSGISGWVTESDTFHALIKEYRESRRILLNIEQRIMLQMAPDYENLSLMQKVEVFSYAMDNTTGKDLYRILWLKSRNSEAWLERRTNYTRSLAVMSMVGYILGLGDRHPSNMLISRETGNVIHIDFGDCFEVAMYRQKYPERVHFRLTRMTTFAMEASNIEGSFRITSEHVMRVIRANKKSLLAVLEAFIYDPLLKWRLNSPRSTTPDDVLAPPVNLPDNNLNQPQPIRPASERVQRRPSIIDPAMIGGSIDETRSLLQDKKLSMDATIHDTKAEQNERALQVLSRIKEKLVGRDLKGKNDELSVSEQVDLLITQATSVENLCQHWVGWCSFW